MFECRDINGKRLYTDNRRLCADPDPAAKSSVVPLAVEVHNLHSQYGSSVSEEYYNYAFRTYRELPGHRFPIVAELRLLDEEPQLVEKAVTKLEKVVAMAMQAYPVEVRREFAGVRYFLFSGTEARTGGRKGGQWYFRRGNNVSSRFDNSVVIRSAQDFVARSDQSAAFTAAHELAHAWYYFHRREIYHKVRQAYQHSEKEKLYRNVRWKNGAPLKRAYASTNAREYFAELSQIYFMGNDYFPFNAEDLKAYDPKGYAMVEHAYFGI